MIVAKWVASIIVFASLFSFPDPGMAEVVDLTSEEVQFKLQIQQSLKLEGKIKIKEVDANEFGLDPWAFGAKPKLIVAIELSIGKRKMFVPRSAFADIVNPRSMDVTTTKEGVVLRILAGDGSESVSVELHIERAKLAKKISRSGIGGSILERVVYP